MEELVDMVLVIMFALLIVSLKADTEASKTKIKTLETEVAALKVSSAAKPINRHFMIDQEYVAGELYTEYCEQVGGLAFNGDPLPDWKTFRNDPSKKKQSDAWFKTAGAAIDLLVR